MVVRKLFRIAFALLVTTHRTAFASHSHRIRILHSHRTFSTFLVVVSWLLNKKRVKSAKNAKKCEMRMQCEKGIKIRIALIRQKKIAFSHRIRIALPSLPLAANDRHSCNL